MYLSRLFLILLTVLTSISYGFLIGKYEFPPHDLLRAIKQELVLNLENKSKLDDICIYRPNLNIVNNDDTFTYKDILTSDFKYKYSLFSDYAYYLKPSSLLDIQQVKTPFDLKDNVFTQYLYRRHQAPSKALVVLIHGNSSIPDDFFNNDTYLGNSGTELFEMGFDILAPYVTHDSRFQNSRARLSTLRDDLPQRLDIQRIINVVSKYHSQYEEIHIAGVSYGGSLAVKALEILKYPRHTEITDKIGTVLSIEGFTPLSPFFENQEEDLLFAWNFEMMFPGTSEKEFQDAINNKQLYLGISSCNKSFFDNSFQKLSKQTIENKVIYFEGGHEFKSSVLIDAIAKKQLANQINKN